MKWLKTIRLIGLTGDEEILLYQRVLLTNSLAVTAMFFCLVLIGISAVFSLWTHGLIAVITFFLILPVFWLNSLKHYLTASFYLVHFVTFAILLGSYLAFKMGRITETENWLYAFMVISVFIFDKWRMYAHFIYFFLVICFTKYIKYIIIGWEFDTDFMLMLVNVMILCVALFVFLAIFKIGFKRSLVYLSNANNSKNKLFSIVSHDIRGPLATMETLLDLGEAGVLSPEEFQNHQRSIRQRFGPLQNTINSMLLWAQSNLNTINANPENFYPREVLDEILETNQPLLETKNIELSTDISDKAIFMDLNHFRIIIRNMIHNAIKFTPSGGSVSLSIKHLVECVEIKIIDTGAGMKPELIEEVLHGHQVTSETGTGGEKGAGVGLSFSIELLRKNGGELTIHSQPERGTTITMTLPHEK